MLGMCIRGIEVQAPLIINLGMRWRCVVNVSPLLLRFLGKSPTVGLEVLKEENLSSFLGIKTPDGPARSQVTVSTVLLWLPKHVGYIRKIRTNDDTRCTFHRVMY
jgi:hypothetical protein